MTPQWGFLPLVIIPGMDDNEKADLASTLQALISTQVNLLDLSSEIMKARNTEPTKAEIDALKDAIESIKASVRKLGKFSGIPED